MSRRGWISLGLCAALAAAWAGAAAIHARPSEPELPVLARLASFQLTDQNDAPFGTEQLRGKVWMLGVAFTSCTATCPMLTAQMANLQRRLAPLGDRAHLVTITVDPETDTPERLREYAARYDADLSRWSFLTGAPEEVRTTLQRGLFVAVGERRDTETGYDILHTNRLMLVDSDGRLRGSYATDEAGLAELVRDAVRLADDAR